MKFKLLCRISIVSLFIFALTSSLKAQTPIILLTDSIQGFSKRRVIQVTSIDLSDYIKSRITPIDTMGKTSDFIKIIRNAKAMMALGLKKDYNDALNLATENFRLKNQIDRVLVIKSIRRLYLLKNGKIIRSFPISLGPKPIGQKEQEGDGKTPEGVYTLDWQRWNTTNFHSFHVSYPNQTDIERARSKGLTPGSNIMVHGTPKRIKEKKDWTDGCIALMNEDMATFRKMVSQDTIIEIRK